MDSENIDFLSDTGVLEDDIDSDSHGTSSVAQTITVAGEKATLLIDADGRYRFADVPLIITFNWFKLALWCLSEAGASDIRLPGHDCMAAKIYGRLHIVTPRGLQPGESESVLTGIKKGSVSAATSVLTGGEPYGDAFALRFPGHTYFRYRVQSTGLQGSSGSADTIGITLRVIPGVPPTCAEIKLPKPIIDMTNERAGLILFCGSTNSGKTTMVGALQRRLLTKPDGIAMVTYESPPEYALVDIPNKTGTVEQSHYGSSGHLHKMEYVMRDFLRRDPDVVNFGEIRDQEEIKGALGMASVGALVMTTVHVNRGADAISRVVRAFPVDQQYSIFLSVVEVIRGIVFQYLAKTPDGKRRPVTEYVDFDFDDQTKLAEAGVEGSRELIDGLIQKKGQSFLDALDCVFHDNGISEEDYKKVKRSYQ